MTTLRAGDLEATWLPGHGMVGASLRHRGEELLGQRGGLETVDVTLMAAAMTVSANALVTGDGLRQVLPGRLFTATFSVSVTAT
ncbi:MAG: aldose 1-epimerase [Solirubrobacterales bacterium]|nr:aldose 1-epimerase [Solirubrobacterales bacterium]